MKRIVTLNANKSDFLSAPTSVRQGEYKSNEELRDDIGRILSKYPRMKELFHQPLTHKNQGEDWLEDNVVAHSVLIERDDLILHEQMLERIGVVDKEAVSHWRVKLQGRHGRDFQDIWTEVNAFDWLISSGFNDIKVIPENSTHYSGKRPDIVGMKASKEYLIEVANLRAPAEIVDKLFNKIYEMKIKRPAEYKRQFDIHAYGIFGAPDMAERSMQEKVSKIMTEVEKVLDTGGKAQYSWKNKDEKQGVIIEIRLGEFSVWGGGDTQRDDIKWRGDILLGITKKFLSIINEKVVQLNLADPDKKKNHMILIKVGIQPYASLFIEKETKELLDTLGEVYPRLLGENISVKWFV